jgi:integrase/recombinase XerC
MNELTIQGLKSNTITAHSLRHTAAALSIKNGVGLYEVSKMLGHTSIQTTQIYTSVLDAETLQINPACLSLDEVF